EMLATASAAVSTIFVISFPLLSGVFVFNHHGNTLANTDTQCSQTPTAVFSFQAERQCPEHARTRCTQRVAQCDRATPGIDAFIIECDAPGIEVDQDLGGKGFIEFNGTNLVPGDAGAFKCQIGGRYRCLAEILRFIGSDTA